MNSNENNDNDGKAAAMSTAETEEVIVDKKRAFLEINDTDKYKQFLLKPFETKRLKTSDALEKVKQFLPSLKESTEKLLNENKDDMARINIENCEDNEQVIEMNLQFTAGSNDSDDSDDEQSEDDDDTTSGSLDDSDDGDEDDESNNAEKFTLQKFINSEIEKNGLLAGSTSSTNGIRMPGEMPTNKMLKTKKKPIINIINSHNNESDTSSQDD